MATTATKPRIRHTSWCVEHVAEGRHWEACGTPYIHLTNLRGACGVYAMNQDGGDPEVTLDVFIAPTFTVAQATALRDALTVTLDALAAT